jgi:NAD(P)-dependent dehydrogenase (short-subunit alcohol dehydrogenase family)
MTGTPLRVLVTAAATGIGRAIVEAFLAHGDRVHVCDVNEPALAAFGVAHPEAGTTLADVADETAVDRLFAEALARLGGLDVLVNNAGIAGPTAAIEDVAYQDWKRCLAVDLDSVFLCARRAAPLLKAQGSGAIVNISSTAGLFGYPNRAPYVAAKWAIVGLTKTLAMELGPFGVRVNAICPGSVEGPRMDRVIAAEAKVAGRSEAEIRAGYTRGVSMRSFVTAGDIAEAVLFLCSPAGHLVSGQALAVDGHTESLVT